MAEPVLEARYFDGRTAVAKDVRVRIAPDALYIEGQDVAECWPMRRLVLVARDGSEIRIGRRGDDAARLVFVSADAAAALEHAYPELLSGRGERRRMTVLVGALVSVSALIAAGVFWGLPAASGPLARATPKELEIQMGENLAGQINLLMRPCKESEDAIRALQPKLDAFAEKGAVGFPIRFQFVRHRLPNAFALPGGQVMATSGLLEATADDQEAFLAVMAHELGHVRARDGMQAIYRNAGAGMVLEIVTGGSGAAQQAVLLAGQLDQLRHSRKQETAADMAAAGILRAAGLDPAALARAFERISARAAAETKEEEDEAKVPTWFSSHPDTAARIKAARARAAKTEDGALLPKEDWERVLKACQARERSVHGFFRRALAPSRACAGSRASSRRRTRGPLQIPADPDRPPGSSCAAR